MRRLARAVLPGGVRRPLRGVLDTARARARWARILAWSRIARRRRPSGSTRPTGERFRLGLLATHFPPEVTGGTYRPAALTRYGAEAGLEIVVIAGHVRQRLTEAGRFLAGRVPRGVTVHRASESELRPLEGVVPSIDGGFLDLLEIHDTALRAFEGRPPDVIFATGPPFHAFVVARLLARRFGIPLVLEYRDEWTESPHSFIRAGPHDRSWERRCLAAADRVVFTTDGQREQTIRAFPVLKRERCAVIPNGWEPDDWRTAGEPGAESGGGPLLISNFGNLHDHLPPDAFLETLDRTLRDRPDLADDIRFQFFGQKAPRSAAALDAFFRPEVIESRPHVPKTEATRRMRRVTALLLLNPPNWERYIQGKLYDFLAAGRPILVFGEGGAMARVLAELGAGLFVPEGDAVALAAALDRIRDGAVVNGLDAREEWLARHTREVLAGRTIGLLRELVSDRSPT